MSSEPTSSRSAPTVIVLHGGRGDLARRMVIPSLAVLHRRGLLPEHWALIGTGRGVQGTEDYEGVVRESLGEFGKPDDDADALTKHAVFTGELGEEDPGPLPGVLEETSRALAEAAGGAPDDVVVVHHLAVPPQAFGPITRALGKHGLARGPDGRPETVRVVFEKPYGTSPESFRELDAVVHEVLQEEQVFRIDHFLGKEAVQNLHVLRFANELFGSVWDRHHIAQVQIDVPEDLDVADRAEFYDSTGAALDMVVSHLFQVAAQVAMEPPRDLDADELVAAREAALADFRALDPDDVVLGQFEGYREIEGIADDSDTDTFVAARLWIDNDRWRGVPFLLRTGKRMALSEMRVSLLLRRVPECLYGDRVPTGRISLSLAGEEAIEVTAAVKQPGPDLTLGTGTARLELDDVGERLSPYASLLDDVLHADRTLFTTATGLESAWAAFSPLLGDERPGVLPYEPGSWGPEEALALAGEDGWVLGG
jgi:glucose-6-phosphate 1-dehydrogenase